MPRDLLGPDRETLAAAAAAGVGTDLASVLRGLAAGARHVLSRRRALAALAATGGHRFLYGILLLMSLLLYRNYFYKTSGSNTALGHYLLIVVASAIGYGAAAVITPVATRRLSKRAWIAVLLAAGGIATAVLGVGFWQPGFLVIGFLLGVTAQGVAICATTVLQQEVDDDFRGRVFSLYDMLFNGAFVAGAAGSALFMPANGHSYAMLLVVAVGYVVAAGGYWLINRQPGGGPVASSGGSPAAATPTSAAQPSNS
jgi:MFS family permease